MEGAALVVTLDHILAAKAAGACTVDYEPGTPVSEVSQSDLLWIEEMLPSLADDVVAPLQDVRGAPHLSALSGYGSGSGSGDGSGYGYGYGVEI